MGRTRKRMRRTKELQSKEVQRKSKTKETKAREGGREETEGEEEGVWKYRRCRFGSGNAWERMLPSQYSGLAGVALVETWTRGKARKQMREASLDQKEREGGGLTL